MSVKNKIISFQKILHSAICFFMLVLFIGALGFELVPPPLQKQHIEVSSSSLHSVINLTVISEEGDSGYEKFDSNQLATEVLLISCSFTRISKNILFSNSKRTEKVLFENNLYLQNRCLRV